MIVSGFCSGEEQIDGPTGIEDKDDAVRILAMPNQQLLELRVPRAAKRIGIRPTKQRTIVLKHIDDGVDASPLGFIQRIVPMLELRADFKVPSHCRQHSLKNLFMLDYKDIAVEKTQQ